MLIDLSQAEAVFSSLAPESTAPTLSPSYVLADAARSADLIPTFWLFERGGSRLLQAFHLGAIPGTDYYDVQSPYGYGGPLTNDHSAGFLEAAWASWCRYCAEARVVCEFIRFHPMLENWRDYGGTTEFDRDTVYIDLRQPDLLASYTRGARARARKAERNVYSVTWLDADEALRVFPVVYHAAMEEIGADESYFFPQKYFEQLLAMAQMKCAVCRDPNGQIVASSLFLVGPKLMEYHLAGATPQGRTQGAPTAILHTAATFGQAAGCSSLYLGGGTSRDPDDKLLLFKASFSAQRRAYHIGRHIHLAAAYDDLKSAFRDQYDRFPQRVLFYRC
ncbi:GNAT family N-acetyltransferase [Rhizomicrobium electricum]|uniref:BioF2-like acetyltransferase domain-containing protein n=1 Tax=Rhizomicrobium electricum TaxID=480070 RepID=A0ABN1EMA9_9PROT|nr:GNAT family N-acetyltransferase [Rhizomicrobium electricum]NIJ46977.1 hypothetical protein [Rhizomicrobium electricum]